MEKGESRVVDVGVELKYATAFWDEIRAAWICEKDTYGVFVGGSSEGTGVVEGEFKVEKTSWWNGL